MLRLMAKVISEINMSIHIIYSDYENCYVHHSLPNLPARLQRSSWNAEDLHRYLIHPLAVHATIKFPASSLPSCAFSPR